MTINSVLSSHEYVMERDRQTIQLLFTNVYLPDSSENQEKSNGFIEFKITPKINIENGIIISNKGDIVFDYEEPLATN